MHRWWRCASRRCVRGGWGIYFATSHANVVARNTMDMEGPFRGAYGTIDPARVHRCLSVASEASLDIPLPKMGEEVPLYSVVLFTSAHQRGGMVGSTGSPGRSVACGSCATAVAKRRCAASLANANSAAWRCDL